MNSLNEDQETSIVSIEEYSPKPWGFWATIGFSILVFMVFQLAGAVVLVAAFVVLTVNNIDAHQLFLQYKGDFICATSISSTLIMCPLIFLIAKFKKDYNLTDYFGLKMPTISQSAFFSSLLILFIFVSEFVSNLLNRPINSWQMEMYKTTNIGILALTIIVAAPLFEELWFRGFMFRGVSSSKLGFIGAILITALTWSMIHVQYGWYEILTIFLLGILLGYTRHSTNSTYLTIGMHALYNAAAIIQMLIYL